MKPSFALNFAEDRIDLLHRATGGWLEVGTVPLDEPDLGAALNYLRGSALGLEPRGITTKLVIPNSQILYTRILAPGPDAANRRAQILAGLEGRTPYAVEDLVFDWSGTGATVQVAVIARETLDEAEAFASDHRFNPVSFVAVPPAGEFASEPWFGPTTSAEAVLGPGEKVERDQDPIKIIMRAAAPQAPVAPPPAQKAYDAEIEVPHVAVASETLPAHPSVDVDVADPNRHAEVLDEDAEGKSPAAVTRSMPTAPAGPREGKAAIAVAAPVIPDDLDDGDSERPMPSALPGPARDRQQALRPVNGKASAAPLRTTARATGKPPEPPLAFSSRRATQEAERDGGERTEPAGVPGAWPPPPGRIASPLPKGGPEKGGPAGTGTARVTAPAIALPKDRGFSQTAKTQAGQTRPGSTGSEAAKAKSGSDIRTPAQRGRPRYLGLILTGILLAFLALVAAWSSIYLASLMSDDTPAVAGLGGAADPVAVADPEADPTPDDEMLADLQDPAEFPIAEATETAPSDAVLATADEPASEALQASPIGTPATVAEVGRNPVNEPQDEIFLAEIDPTPATADAVAVAEPNAPPDPLPEAQLTPPPFGTLYTFDAQGLIVPTPEGIITPEGVRLVAGRPSLVPPERPEAPAIAPIPTDIADTAAPVAEPVFAADPALAGARPRSRPEGLAPAAPDADDDAALTAEAVTRVSGLRPRARPDDALAAANPLPDADQAALDAAVQAVSASLVASAESPVQTSVLAVAVSRKPAPRPALPDKAVADAVEAAVVAASAPAEPEKKPVATAPTLALAPAPEAPAGNPEDVDEPEVTSAAPNIPTRASVAKQATYRNAFNLSKTNLIGVYGTSSNRYAMVRQANGRFVKVEVGDRLDGGKVAAISEREVRYVKNGKTLTLAMPKG